MPETSSAFSTVDLVEAYNDGLQQQRQFSENRAHFYKGMMGAWWGSTPADDKKIPLNLVNQYVAVVLAVLLSHKPQVSISSEVVAMHPYLKMLTRVTKHALKEANWHLKRRLVAMDMLMWYGVARVVFAGNGELWEHKPGVRASDILVEHLSPDRVVVDPEDKTPMVLGNWSWACHRYAVPKSLALSCGLFEPDMVESLPVVDGPTIVDRAARLQRAAGRGQRIVDYVELLDFFLPHDQVVVTVAAAEDASAIGGVGGISDTPLSVRPWEGREEGPYTFFGVEWMPDQKYPVIPVAVWWDLFEMANLVFRKLLERAAAAKQVLAYEADAEDTADALGAAQHGQKVKVRSLDGVELMSWDIKGDDSMQFIEYVKTVMSEQAGNMEQAGGVASRVNTARQAQILQANSELRNDSIQGMFNGQESEVVAAVAYYMHHVPNVHIPLQYETPGIAAGAVQLMFTDEVREGDFTDFWVSVETSSASRQPPMVRADSVAMLVLDIAPRAMQAAAGGVPINVEAFLRDQAKDRGAENWGEYWLSADFQAQQAMLAQGMGSSPGMQQVGGTPGRAQGAAPAFGDPGAAPGAPDGGTTDINGSTGSPTSPGAPGGPAGGKPKPAGGAGKPAGGGAPKSKKPKAEAA